MASTGNINREIQLIIDVIDYKMFKGEYLVGMLSPHPIHIGCGDNIQCDYKFFCGMIIIQYDYKFFCAMIST